MTESPVTLTAAEIAAAVRSGSLSATEVVEAHLDRIATVNPAVNAASVVLEDHARQAAAELDERRRRGEDVGPLAGVPISVKENIDCVASATTSGLPFAASLVPATNATFLQRLIDAGAIPVARGNMPDFGLRWATDNDLFGRTLNPWDPTRGPEGSSGGDAVIVATGMAAAGLGNDYGGSLRLPANAAGVTALRPTTGRITGPSQSIEPIPLTVQTYATNGPIARSVEDLDLLFSVMHGADGIDPLSITVPHPREYDGPRRAAVTYDPTGAGVDPHVEDAIRRGADALVAAGWDVVEVDPPHVERATALWEQLALVEMQQFFEPDALPGPLSAGSMRYWQLVNTGVPLLDTAAAYGGAWAERFLIAAEWRAFHATYPVVLGPVSTGPTPVVDFDLISVDTARSLVREHRLTTTVNLLGLPSVAVPTGLADGRPHGVQLIASSYQDHVALAAARDVEKACGRLTPIDPRTTNP